MRQIGKFTVKEPKEGELGLVYESGPGLQVRLRLAPDMSAESAVKMARILNGNVTELLVDPEPRDPGTKWMRPLKAREYYLDDQYDKGVDAEKQLYLAVICGQVRARINGRVLGPEWLKQLARTTFDDSFPFALPPNLQVSVDDVKCVWGLR